MTPDFPTHQPHRGSDVEAWLKRCREVHRDGEGALLGAWYAIDDMLDHYRTCADTGRSLLLDPDD